MKRRRLFEERLIARFLGVQKMSWRGLELGLYGMVRALAALDDQRAVVQGPEFFQTGEYHATFHLQIRELYFQMAGGQMFWRSLVLENLVPAALRESPQVTGRGIVSLLLAGFLRARLVVAPHLKVYISAENGGPTNLRRGFEWRS